MVQDGKLVFINPMTTMMIDYSGEDLMSRSFVEFIHPDDRDMVLDRHVRRIKGEELPQHLSDCVRQTRTVYVLLTPERLLE